VLDYSHDGVALRDRRDLIDTVAETGIILEAREEAWGRARRASEPCAQRDRPQA
jgi:hypothetical protein